MIIVRFVGIDYWNRPVFKQDNVNNFFGSVEILFDYDVSEKEVLEKLTGEDLVYFGDEFDCEPMGSLVDYLKIERNL